MTKHCIVIPPTLTPWNDIVVTAICHVWNSADLPRPFAPRLQLSYVYHFSPIPIQFPRTSHRQQSPTQTSSASTAKDLTSSKSIDNMPSSYPTRKLGKTGASVSASKRPCVRLRLTMQSDSEQWACPPSTVPQKQKK